MARRPLSLICVCFGRFARRGTYLIILKSISDRLVAALLGNHLSFLMSTGTKRPSICSHKKFSCVLLNSCTGHAPHFAFGPLETLALRVAVALDPFVLARERGVGVLRTVAAHERLDP